MLGKPLNVSDRKLALHEVSTGNIYKPIVTVTSSSNNHEHALSFRGMLQLVVFEFSASSLFCGASILYDSAASITKSYL